MERKLEKDLRGGGERMEKFWWKEEKEKVKRRSSVRRARPSFCSRVYRSDPSIFQAGGFDRGPPTNRIWLDERTAVSNRSIRIPNLEFTPVRALQFYLCRTQLVPSNLPPPICLPRFPKVVAIATDSDHRLALLAYLPLLFRDATDQYRPNVVKLIINFSYSRFSNFSSSPFNLSVRISISFISFVFSSSPSLE